MFPTGKWKSLPKHATFRLYFVPKSWHITWTLSSWAGQALSLTAPKAEGIVRALMVWISMEVPWDASIAM